MTQNHPTHEQLTAYRDGRMDKRAENNTEMHLADCRLCCEQLDAMPDSIVDLFRAPPATDDAEAFLILSGEEHDAHEAHVSVDTADDLAVGEDLATNSHAQDNATRRRPKDELLSVLPNHPRYRILELLGHGGMGDVYKAEHRLMQRTVALKVIRRKLVRHPQAVDRFRREVQAAARLDHPNIVTAYDAEHVGDRHFLVMEYVDGVTLAEEVANRGPLPIHEACEYIRQAALGLEHAHEQGMVHRDIKPHNLMLDSGKVKILDFGLASLVTEPDQPSRQLSFHEDGSQLTRSGAMMGTPDYVSPEQAGDARNADIRADIYSLGCTLHFLLTGHAPVRRQANLTSDRPDVPRKLDELVRRMLAERPEDRFQTPGEIASDLLTLTSDVATKPHARDETEVALPALDLECSLTKSPKPQVDWSARYALGCMAIVALAFIGLVALASYVIVIASDYGKIIVESEVDDVQVVVLQSGREVQVIDLKTDSHLRLASGEYRIELKGNANHVELDREQLTLSRLGEEVVRIRRVPDIASANKSAVRQPPVITNPRAEPVDKPVDQRSASTNRPSSNSSLPWIDILDRSSLDGWRSDGSAQWSIENCILVGRGRRGHGRLLYTRETFEDVEVRVECKVNAGGNSGIYVRTGFGSQFDNGYEAQITNLETQSTWTGGIWPHVPVKRRLIDDDTWFVMEVRVSGNVVSVKVNGERTAQFIDNNRQFRSGMIALQAWGSPTEVSFRRIQIRRPDTAASTGAEKER